MKQPLTESSPGVFVGPWHDDFDFSRVLLLPRLISACRVKGAPLVFAPLVGRVWLTGSEDEAGLHTVLDELERRREQSRQHVGAFAQSVTRRASTELS